MFTSFLPSLLPPPSWRQNRHCLSFMFSMFLSSLLHSHQALLLCYRDSRIRFQIQIHQWVCSHCLQVKGLRFKSLGLGSTFGMFLPSLLHPCCALGHVTDGG